MSGDVHAVNLGALHQELSLLAQQGAARNLPIDVLQDVRNLAQTLAAHGIGDPTPRRPAGGDIPLPPLGGHEPPPAAAPAGGGATRTGPVTGGRIGFAREAGGGWKVNPKDPASVPVARTIQTLLDAMTGRPLGSRTVQFLELGAYVEALELRCEQLEAQLVELTGQPLR